MTSCYTCICVWVFSNKSCKKSCKILIGLCIEQYRMRVSRFVFALKHKSALSLIGVLCTCVIFYSKNKLDAIAVIVFWILLPHIIVHIVRSLLKSPVKATCQINFFFYLKSPVGVLYAVLLIVIINDKWIGTQPESKHKQLEFSFKQP